MNYRFFTVIKTVWSELRTIAPERTTAAVHLLLYNPIVFIACTIRSETANYIWIVYIWSRVSAASLLWGVLRAVSALRLRTTPTLPCRQWRHTNFCRGVSGARTCPTHTTVTTEQPCPTTPVQVSQISVPDTHELNITRTWVPVYERTRSTTRMNTCMYM